MVVLNAFGTQQRFYSISLIEDAVVVFLRLGTEAKAEKIEGVAAKMCRELWP